MSARFTHWSAAGRRAALAVLPDRAAVIGMRRDPLRNLTAGVTVAVVALPLALAFGVASGLGASAGLTTAIIGGLAAALLGGSNLQVSGPTGAMTVVLIPIVHRYGVNGALLAGLLAGVFLVGLALARCGRYVRYLPLPVIEGFTVGIALVIALQQVPAALGVHVAGSHGVLVSAVDAVGTIVAHPAVAPIVLALGVAAIMLAGARWRPGAPFSLLGVALATILAAAFHLRVARIGALPQPLHLPSAGFLDPQLAMHVLPAAAAIAALAALESLLSATVADGMSVSDRHDPERELFGQGAGVLLATTIRMVDPATVRALLGSSRGDAGILLVTAAVTVSFDLVTAVGVGVVLAMLVTLKRLAETTTFEQRPAETADHRAEEAALRAERIVVFRPDGPLFFGAANRFLVELTDLEHVDAVVLRCSGITTLDATGAAILGDGIRHLERRGVPVVLSGVDRAHDHLLAQLADIERLRERGRVFADTPAAISYARETLAHHRRAVAPARAQDSLPAAHRCPAFTTRWCTPMPDSTPICPECQSEYTYERDAFIVCSMCAHEWPAAGGDAGDSGEKEIRDAVGNVLADGDDVTVIKDLKVKGASGPIKRGTKVRGIRLVDGVGDHDIDCKVDGFGPMQLKSSVVKKA